MNAYPTAIPDGMWWTREGVWCGGNITIEAFSDWALQSTPNLNSCPGLPWVGMGLYTVESVIREQPEWLRDAVMERIRARLFYNFEQLVSMSPLQLAQSGLKDVVRVFVKNEPITEKKVLAHRERLIMNCGLTDILCDRITCDSLYAVEIVNWASCPSKPGMGLDDESVQNLMEHLPGSPSLATSADASAFDFHVKTWQLIDTACIEAQQYGVSLESDLGRLLVASAWVTCNKVYALPNGTLYQQTNHGVQESGGRGTAPRNSKARVYMAFLCGATAAIAMGDDSLEWGPDFTASCIQYDEIGQSVEAALVPPPYQVEFCSHHFKKEANGRWIAVPLNWHKSLFRLLSHTPNPDLRRAFEYEMRHSPNLARMKEFLDLEWK